MSAKMNWDRLRKETQTRRSGSEWIGSDAVGRPNRVVIAATVG